MRDSGIRPRAAWLSLSQEVSGAEYSLLEAMRWTNAEHALLCPPGELWHLAEQQGWPVSRVPTWLPTERGGMFGGLRSISALRAASRMLSRAVGEISPDVLIANGLRPSMLAAMSKIGGRGTPVIWVLRDFPPKRATLVHIARALSRRTASVVANSEAVAEEAYQVWRLPARPLVIHPGITWRQPLGGLRQELAIGEGVPLFAVVGQITPWKGQEDAIHAARIAREAVPELRLVIIGAPKFHPENRKYYRNLTELAAEDAGKTLILGERGDLERVYPDLTALLVPSRREPFGRVAAEAMGYGTRIICYASGGLRELARAPYGCAVPERDVAGLATAMVAEAHGRQRLSTSEMAVIRAKFSAESAGKKWLEIIHRSVN